MPNKDSPKINIPIVAIRFNACEESLEDVTRPYSDSLSSSPQQGNSDDSSWHKDLFQGTIFGRKRSGSIEGLSNPIFPSMINDPSSKIGGSHSDSVGTWKLIKGKVSQAMEDIKSSKSEAKAGHEPNWEDSDADSATINSSMSDEFNEMAFNSHTTSHIIQPISNTSKRDNTDSDSDIDADLLIMSQDTDSYILKKSFDNLRYRKRNTRDSLLSRINKTKEEIGSSSPNISSSSPSKKKPDKVKAKTTDGGYTAEIESGVEITEEMTLNGSNESNDVSTDLFKNCIESDGDEANTQPTMLSKNDGAENDDSNTNSTLEKKKFNFLVQIMNYRHVFMCVTVVLMCWLFCVPPFIQGMLACLCSMSIFSAIYRIVLNYVSAKINKTLHTIPLADGGHGPERIPFAIPNYNNMSICEIPAAEEHKPQKLYSGWMNEINNYDPSNYHSSMTRSVFIKLDGTILHISNTKARIPKRAIWNEVIAEKKNITYNKHRRFDLFGCRIEMCPRGLARKRHFNRKYPIQLIIKNASPHPKNKSEFPFEDSTDKLGSSLDSIDSTSLRDDRPSDLDYGSTIMFSDLQKFQQHQDQSQNAKDSVPCGDDIRILLFARTDREKEDWFRRFHAASNGLTADQQLQFPDLVFVDEDDCVAALKAVASESLQRNQKVTAGNPANLEKEPASELSDEKSTASSAETVQASKSGDSANNSENSTERKDPTRSNSIFEGLLMTSCAARAPSDYIQFMSTYQNACSLRSIPVIQAYPIELSPRKNRREKKQEDELWKGIDQSLYLGPSGSVVWANVLVGRILFSCLNDAVLLENIQEFLQKKLSAVKLPNFMEDVIIAQVNLGDTPPLIHRVSQPLLDERGTWIDADVTYEGLMHMTITTKLNLLRLKRQHASTTMADSASGTTTPNLLSGNSNEKVNDAIYDSNAESSGASSSECDSPTHTHSDTAPEHQIYHGQGSSASSAGSGGGSKKFLRIVDRITASNLFQSATEISLVQKAMENMSTKLRLRVELKGLVGRCIINIPPPPSDRIWLGFRGPPRLWISATPAVGEHTFDWSIVTNAIESKLCDEVSKYLVYPNMVDVIVPFLGHATYRE